MLRTSQHCVGAIDKALGRMVSMWMMALLLSVSMPLMAGDLALYTEEHPPFSKREHGVLGGISVQVVHELMRRSGEQVPIELLPWTRSYAQVLNGANVGVFPMVRTAEREAHFQWVGPLTNSHMSIYTRRSDGLNLRSIDDLKALGAIAIPKGWFNYEYLEQMGLQNLHGVGSQNDVLRLFQYGRTQVLISDILSIGPLLASQSMPLDLLEWQFDLLSAQGYIALSHSVSAQRVAMWQSHLDAMRADGTLHRVYRQALPQLSEAQLTQLLNVSVAEPAQLAAER